MDTFVSYLRRKLGDVGRSRIIHAVRGVGLVLRDDDRGSGRETVHADRPGRRRHRARTGTGHRWLLLPLVAADLRADGPDAHLRERAVAVAKDARSLLRASAADRSAAVSRPMNAVCSPRPWTWAYD